MQERRSARVILVDDDHRVLLFRIVDGERHPVWITPGGGVEEGESLLDAAVRELREETGLEVRPETLGSPVAMCGGPWVFRGTHFLAEDVFFALRTSSFTPDDQGWTDLEREVHDSWRWCPSDELDSLDGVVLPAGLSGVVERIFAGAPHGAPVVLPWRVV